MVSLFKKILSFILSLPVYFYRYVISPHLSPSCRHVPTCSHYMLDALRLHGPFYGLGMGMDRIMRCRPGGTHGYDPVPLFRIRRYKPLLFFLKRWKRENRLKH